MSQQNLPSFSGLKEKGVAGVFTMIFIILLLVGLPLVGGYFFFKDGTILLDKYHRTRQEYLVHSENHHPLKLGDTVAVEGYVSSSNDTTHLGFVAYGVALHGNTQTIQWDLQSYTPPTIELKSGNKSILIKSESLKAIDPILKGKNRVIKVFERQVVKSFVTPQLTWCSATDVGGKTGDELLVYGIKREQLVFVEGVIENLDPLVIHSADITWPGSRGDWYAGFVTENSEHTWRGGLGFFVMIIFLAMAFKYLYPQINPPKKESNGHQKVEIKNLRNQKFDEILNKQISEEK